MDKIAFALREDERKLGKNVSIYDVYLDPPSRTSPMEDFKISFQFRVPRMDETQQTKVKDAIAAILPIAEFYTDRNGSEVNREFVQRTNPYSDIAGNLDTFSYIGFKIANSKDVNVCKHLAEMFKKSGVPVMAMGQPYSEPPVFKGSKPPEHLERAAQNFEDFAKYVSGAVDNALIVSKTDALKGRGAEEKKYIG